MGAPPRTKRHPGSKGIIPTHREVARMIARYDGLQAEHRRETVTKGLLRAHEAGMRREFYVVVGLAAALAAAVGVIF